MRKFQITKTVPVDVDVDIQLSSKDIIANLDEDDLEEIMEEMGYVKKEDLHLSEGTLSEQLKLEIVGKIIKKATLEQLENFEKSL